MKPIYLILTLLVFLGYNLHSQKGKSCDTPLPLSIKNLNKHTFNYNPEYILVNIDTSALAIDIDGSFNKIKFIFSKNNCKGPLTRETLSFDKNHQIIPSKSQQENGFCFCNDCSKKWKRVFIDKEQSFILEVYGKKLDFKILTKEDFREKEWFEKKYKKGDAIQLKNILFNPAKATFVRSSEKELKQLYKLLKKHPELKVEIQGHVNGPFQKNSKEFQELSNERAEAVYLFLIRHGINPKQLTHKGYGNSKMVNPKARSEQEMILNRRVEIVVL